jgi:hypothetical protein
MLFFVIDSKPPECSENWGDEVEEEVFCES